MNSNKLNIIHYNDVYELRGTDQPGVCGGADRFCALVNKLKQEHNPLILFSGDLWNPSKCIFL
jgi:2',3'-cyclic-nucleotide 2'-phosphodiesterase (5'-nucleotidase family)